ncbi:hypothetical protein QLQ97_28045, partial [Burkholderia pseudomallei]|nr:hypothetical protein [Burkholderia pseudomallei]
RDQEAVLAELTHRVGEPFDVLGALLGGVAAGHWHAAELAALAPGATRVAAPVHDAALAARYTRFIELYRRTQGWFGAGG